MRYTLIIHKDPASSYGVIVADLPGCFSGGDTLEEAISSAGEAIDLHLCGLIEDGEPVPEPLPVDQVPGMEEAAGAFCLVPIEIDGEKYQPGR